MSEININKSERCKVYLFKHLSVQTIRRLNVTVSRKANRFFVYLPSQKLYTLC